MIPHTRFAPSRREFISQSAAGFGGLALSFLLQQELMRAEPPALSALSIPRNRLCLPKPSR